MVYFSSIDPYRSDGGRYECVSCGYRTSHGEHPGACPRCDGQIRDISRPRE